MATMDLISNLTESAKQLLSYLRKENLTVWQFLLDSFLGLPTSLEAEEEAQEYFAANSSISAAVLTNPGGSLITEILYESKSTSSFIDEYFLQSKSGLAVKARLIAVEKKLLQVIEDCRRNNTSEILIGNLGSGPGRDVIDVFSNYYPNAGDLRAVHVDIDEMALQKGQRMAKIQKVDHLIEFTCANYLHYTRHHREKFDIILLIGVICPFDAVGCVSHLELIKKLLKPNGYLIVSNVSKKMLEEDPFTYHIMSRLGNWNMVFKDEKELAAILGQAGYKFQECSIDSYGFHLIGIGVKKN